MGIDEQSVDQIGELVTGGAGDEPASAQALERRENFLDDDVERLPECVGALLEE